MTAPILLVTTGGTIVSRRTESGAFAPVDRGDALLDHLRDQAHPIRHVEFSSIESAEMRFDNVARLAHLLQAQLADGTVQGAVVTHGTDTMEETALLLDLFVRGDAPVVLTGSQLPADDSGSDAGRNLRAAVRVAGSDAARGLGALLVFDGKIHAAAGVTKQHTSALDGFGSREGPLGHVDRDQVTIRRRIERLPALPIVTARREVDIIQAGLDADGRLLRASIASGARGIVLSALGRGNAGPDLVAAVREACAAAIPVVLVSRCQDGAVLPLNVSGRAMHEAGAQFAGRWRATQARLLLSVALAAADDGPSAVALLQPFFAAI